MLEVQFGRFNKFCIFINNKVINSGHLIWITLYIHCKHIHDMYTSYNRRLLKASTVNEGFEKLRRDDIKFGFIKHVSEIPDFK